jgi:hypothetical protein
MDSGLDQLQADRMYISMKEGHVHLQCFLGNVGGICFSVA